MIFQEVNNSQFWDFSFR